MYSESDVFKHDWHSSKNGANLDCYKCHSKTVSKGMDFKNQPEKITSACLKCHNDMFPQESQTKHLKSYKTYSYVDAMHYSCIKCHNDSLAKDEELRKRNPDIAQCSNCHKNINLSQNYNKLAKQKEYNKFLVIPFLDK